MSEKDLAQTAGDPEGAPADAGDDEAAAIWKEFDEQEQGSADPANPTEPPEEGRNEGQDGNAADFPDESEPPQDPAAQTQGDPAPGAKATGREPADEWASAPPELRTRIDEILNERKRIGQDYAAARRQIGQLRAEMQQLRSQVSAPPNGAAPTDKAAPAGSLLDDDDLKAVADEYPEIAKPFMKVIGHLERRLAEFEPIGKQVVQERVDAAVLAEENALRATHADYDAFLKANGKAFLDWVETQPRHIREAVDRNREVIQDAEEAADVISRFKAHMGVDGSRTANPAPNGGQQPLSGKRTRQLAASAAPQGRTISASAGIPEDGDEKAIWAAFDALEERQSRSR